MRLKSFTACKNWNARNRSLSHTCHDNLMTQRFMQDEEKLDRKMEPKKGERKALEQELSPPSACGVSA